MRSRVARAETAGARDRRRERLLLVEPQRLAAPDDAVHGVAVERHDSVGDTNRLAASRFDDDLVRRLPRHRRQHARPAVLLPVAQHQHLCGERRVAVDRVELSGQRDAGVGAVGVHARIRAVDRHVAIDVHEPIAPAFGLEVNRREVGLRAQRRRELDATAAIGEIDVGGELEGRAISPRLARSLVAWAALRLSKGASDLVSLVPDRFLNVVKPQRAALDRRVDTLQGNNRRCHDEQNPHGGNHMPDALCPFAL